MIGYHYTSYQCWKHIKKNGLYTYPIKKRGFIKDFGTDELIGIWLWQHELKGLAHTGNILYQAAMKSTTEIVYLKVEYYKPDTYKPLGLLPGQEFKIIHDGHIGNLKYHTGKEKAVINQFPIPIERIKLIKIYNLNEIFK